MEGKMDEMNPREKKVFVYKACGAFIFLAFALAGAFYGIWKGDWNFVAFCLVLEMNCSCVLLYSKHYLKGELRAKHTVRSLTVAKYCGIVGGVLNMIACILFIVLGSMSEEDFSETSYYVVALIQLIAAFWAFVFAFDCRKYARMLLEYNDVPIPSVGHAA